MTFRKLYDEKEVECPVCHQKIKPLIESNKFRLIHIPWYQWRHSGFPERKYLLICPNCKAVIGSK